MQEILLIYIFIEGNTKEVLLKFSKNPDFNVPNLQVIDPNKPLDLSVIKCVDFLGRNLNKVHQNPTINSLFTPSLNKTAVVRIQWEKLGFQPLKLVYLCSKFFHVFENSWITQFRVR